MLLVEASVQTLHALIMDVDAGDQELDRAGGHVDNSYQIGLSVCSLLVVLWTCEG